MPANPDRARGDSRSPSPAEAGSRPALAPGRTDSGRPRDLQRLAGNSAVAAILSEERMRSSSPATPHDIDGDGRAARPDLSAATVVSLQAHAGNAAVGRLLVQRLAMTPELLVTRAGDPKSDLTLTLPFFDDRTLKTMSKKYNGIRVALISYHSQLDSGNALDPRSITGKALLTLGWQIHDQCGEYLEAHAAAWASAQKKLLKESKSNESKSKKDKKSNRYQKIDDRNRTITELQKQLYADVLAIGRIVNNPPPFGQPLEFATWRSILAMPTEHELQQSELKGDPRPKDPSHQQTPPTFASGYRTPPPPRVVGPAAAEPRLSGVQVVAGANNPVRTAFGQQPNPDQLYRGNVVVQGPADRMVSTIARPTVQEALLPDNLFIDRTVSHDEISQGGIGDCYVLAAVAGIATKDPKHIVSMMRVDGGEVVTRFYRLDPNTLAWVPQRVRLPQTIATDPAQAWRSGIVGSGFKVASNPARHEWYADLSQGVAMRGAAVTNVKVYRRDLYEAALWAPYLEKAHARFAQDYGQYGVPNKGKATSDNGAALSGYEIIHGGDAKDCYGLFYGVAGSGETHETTYDASATDADNLAANQRTIALLLQMKDRRLTDDQDQPIARHVTVAPGMHNSVSRTVSVLKAVRNDKAVETYLGRHLPNAQAVDDLGVALGELDADLAAAPALIAATKDKDLNAVMTPLQQKALKVVKPGQPWSTALSSSQPDKPRILDDLFTLAGDLVTLGDDNTQGQRHLYSRHAYTVLDAVFRDASGAVIGDLDHARLDPQALGRVDVEKSSVTLYNPHHGNTPDPTGGGEIGAAGRFDLPLRKFLLHIGDVTTGTVRGRQNP